MFKIWNATGNKFKFQVYPPFTYGNTVKKIALEELEVERGTSHFVTGWGYTEVRQHIQYYCRTETDILPEIQ